jgi:hypothetical protein
MSSTGEWKRHVTMMCGDAWELGPLVTEKVIQGLEFLVAADQVSDFTVADVLCRVGVGDADADMAAPGIRATIQGSGAPNAFTRSGWTDEAARPRRSEPATLGVRRSGRP